MVSINAIAPGGMQPFKPYKREQVFRLNVEEKDFTVVNIIKALPCQQKAKAHTEENQGRVIYAFV